MRKFLPAFPAVADGLSAAGVRRQMSEGSKLLADAADIIDEASRPEEYRTDPETTHASG